MRYILRADASQTMGSGHVMRLFAIAEELLVQDKKVIFVGSVSSVKWLKQRLSGIDFFETFEKDHMFISNPITDVLILDAYHIPIQNYFIQKKNWKAIAALVDQTTPSYDADLHIYPSITLDWKPTTVKRFLAGPKYIPLRKSIIKNTILESITNKLKIVVVGGGTDLHNFASAIAMSLMPMPDIFQVNIFSDRLNHQDLDSRFTIIPFGADLDEKVNDADLVFTTASTSCLEFIAREITVGMGCAVDNQEQYYESFRKLNIAIPIGRYINGTWKIDHDKIKDLVTNAGLREELKLKTKNIIDLNGSKRIVDEIVKL
jgi:spore coat polysaccharide biosynthesis predicted glycosyltransferase SpsG